MDTAIKKCPKCGLEKSKDSFVTVYGYKSSRGKYCHDCFRENEQERAILALEGRDFCLYCGAKITKLGDRGSDGKSTKVYVHLDHMDPLSLGGDVEDNNTVCCCVKCNLSKSNKLFTEWLETLKEPYKSLSRDVYIKKHGHDPEAFEKNDATFTISAELLN